MTAIYDLENYDVRHALGGLIGRARVALIDALDEALARHELSGAQYVVIVLLANGMATRASELCKALSYDPGAMTRLLDRLERKGVIRRARSTEDRRSIKLELTAKGRALYPKVLAIAIGILNRFLTGFTKTEVRQMEGFLERMLVNAGRPMVPRRS